MRYAKHLSLALILSGLSMPLLANNGIWVPNQKGGVKVAANVLYLKQNIINNVNDSNYDWGMYAQVGYLFPCTGNDLTVNYMYFHPQDNDKNNIMDLDNVDLEGGQRIKTNNFDIRLFAGLRYGHLNYSSNDDTQSMISKFHGFGPKCGVDARYQLCNGFGLDTHINTGLVVGTLSSTYQKKDTNSIYESMNHVMPHASAKIGLDYTCTMCDDRKSALVFEGGYQTDHYFKAIKDISCGTSYDLNNYGPYVEIKYYA